MPLWLRELQLAYYLQSKSSDQNGYYVEIIIFFHIQVSEKLVLSQEARQNTYGREQPGGRRSEFKSSSYNPTITYNQILTLVLKGNSFPLFTS